MYVSVWMPPLSLLAIVFDDGVKVWECFMLRLSVKGQSYLYVKPLGAITEDDKYKRTQKVLPTVVHILFLILFFCHI